MGYNRVQIMLEYNNRYPEVATALISIAGFSDRVMDSFKSRHNCIWSIRRNFKKLSPVVPMHLQMHGDGYMDFHLI